MERKQLKIILILFCLFLFHGNLHSQFVNFGRNKVHYSDFDWHVLSTKHFQIYYYKEAKELAEQGAFFAEESYKDLQQKFNHSLIDTVPLIVYASPLHFKQTNVTPGLIPEGVGGFFEFIKGRVVIPYEGSLGNLKHVIKHELVHVFMVSKLISTLKVHGIITERLPPLWFTEGLAEYWSTEWNTQAEMVLKDAVLNNYIVGLNNWEWIYGTFLMYKLGQKVLEYIAITYGEEKILELMENFWMDDNFSNVMEYTIGKGYEEFDKEFLYYLKKEYFPQLKESDDPSQVSRNVFSDGFAHKPTYVKTNNSEDVYFIGNLSGYTSIYKVNLYGKRDLELIVEGETKDEFEHFHFFRTGIDVSSTGLLAFVTQKGESDALHIYDINSGEFIANYSFDDIVRIGSPCWGIDSKSIIFPATEFTGKCDLYILDLESKNLKRLTNDFYDDRDPDISPDGRYIAFSSNRTSYGNNRYNLFIYDLETDAIDYLTVGNHVDYSPAFSDDGNKIIFTSDASGPQNIWMIDLSNYFLSSDQISGSTIDTSTLEPGTLQMKRLTNFTTAAYDPKWCGKNKIVFSSFEYASITVRMIEGVDELFEKTEVVEDIDFKQKGERWIISKIEGEPTKNPLVYKKYKKRYSLDIATTSFTTDPVFGTHAGGIISFSDLLGNDKYYFLIYNTSDTQTEFWKSFNVAISKLSLEHRLNYAYGVYHLSGKRYDLREADLSYHERIYGGYLSLFYPLSFFRRIEASLSISQSIKDVDILDYQRSLLLSNTISYVHDNSLWGITGPMDGERYNVTLGYTTDIENSKEDYYSVLLDYRRYIRISRPVCLALRGQFFMNEGKNPRRYFMGGTWSLRGWSRNSIRGTKMWQGNAELRFPLVDLITLRFPLDINLYFPGIRGALFFDAGNAWDEWGDYEETKGSIGAGFRLNAFGFIVLRYDIGKRIEKNFTKLQGNLFHQFFFGWDF
jgi:Tol biopolymer transport system component